MDPGKMVDVVQCRTAGDLLDELDPRRGRAWRVANKWQEGRAWIFRGVSDARHALQASAFRPNAFGPLLAH